MEMTYTNDQGLEVKTSASHKKRGRCCKSSCLHCPYGFTLKNNGIEFAEITHKDLDKVNSMFAGIKLDMNKLDEYRIFTIKKIVAGIIKIDKLFVREFYLAPHFDEQELNKELIESYFFY